MAAKLTFKELEQRGKELEEQALAHAHEVKVFASIQKLMLEYQKAVECSEDLIIAINRKYVYTLVNEAFLRYHCLNRDQVVGQTIAKVMGEKVFKSVIQPNADRCFKGESVDFEMIYHFPEFGERNLLVSYYPVKSNEDEVTGIVVVTKDITVPKMAAKGMRESEEMLRSLFNTSPDGIVITTLDGKILDANQAFQDMLGYTLEELKTISYQEFTPEKWHKAVAEAFKTISSDKVQEGYGTFDKEYLRKDGAIFPVSLTGWILKDKDGIPNRIGVYVRDVTETKRAGEVLRQSEEKLRSLVENTSDWIWEVDHESIYTYASPKVREVLGYSPEEVVGKSLVDFMPEDEASLAARFFKDSIESEKPFSRYERTHLHKEGRRVILETTGVPIFDSEGNIQGFRGFGRDITKRVRAEEEKAKLQEQLLQVRKMEAIGTLAGGIAHEFNNILGIIVGNTEAAIGEIPASSDIRNNLEEVRTACLRARDVVKQMLIFSRRTKQGLKPIKMGKAIEEILKLLRSSSPASIEIQNSNSSESDTVRADPVQLNEILINLWSNALYAMRDEGGILEICLENVELDEDAVTDYLDLNPGAYIRLTVRDTGHGMEREVMERIFDPYFSTKETGKGTGMGLAVVHGMVKNHGGEITVYSEPGKGSAFHVLFPVMADEIKPEIVQSQPSLKGNERILFVDDEESLAFATKHTMENFGYEIVAKRSAVNALKTFREQAEKFDMVITDMSMPDMTGDKLTKEIMKIRPDIPVILCTGFSERMSEEKAKEMGIRAFVMKPYLRREMAKTIRQVLDEKSKSIPTGRDGLRVQGFKGPRGQVIIDRKS